MKIPYLLKISLICIATLLLLASCETAKEEVISDLEEVLEPGFECRISPSELDGPGWLIEVTRDKKIFRVKNFEKETNVKSTPLEVPVISRKTVYNGSLLANLLKAAGNFTGANISASGSNVKIKEIQLSDAMQEIIFQIDEDKIVTWANVVLKPKAIVGSRYFLIRESVAAKGFKFEVSEKDTAALGGSAKFRELVEAQSSLGFTDEKSTKLEAILDKPLRVCIKSRELVFVPGLDGSGDYNLLNSNALIGLSTIQN